MNRDLVLSRSRSSRRVRHLSASAIRVAVYECCAQTLDPIAAELLARNLTATDAVERFRRQAKIPRRGMSGAQLSIYRTYVVAKETIEDASRPGTPVELHDRELLERIRTTQETISSMRKAIEQREQLSGDLERSGSRFRQFVRRADRLWRRQESRLRATIYDAQHYEDAMTELAVLYAKAYRDALQETRVGPPVT